MFRMPAVVMSGEKDTDRLRRRDVRPSDNARSIKIESFTYECPRDTCAGSGDALIKADIPSDPI